MGKPQVLRCEDVIAQFKARYPHVAVSAAGADHIQRAINYGHSFLEVTREFGQFVKEMIDARSREFTATTVNNAASPEHPPA